MPAYRTRDTPSKFLEVTTDAPVPPTVAIISPTPRAFTFPINNDAHFASPSSSPFEPNLKRLTCTPPPLRTFSPTSSIDTESSILSTPSAPASLASHKRRRSTASDIGERRPKKGDEDYVKRPENAFILFRRKCCEDRQQALEEGEDVSAPVKKQRQADLSKMISHQWKSLSPEEKQKWEELAKEKKKEHEALYPNYVYRPQRTKTKEKLKKGKARRGDGEADTDDSISFTLPIPQAERAFLRPGHTRRAASAPTPPPAFQTIQLPTVYMPSCPASPTLIPRISRRSPLPNIPPPSELDPMTHFENVPDDSLFRASFQLPSAKFGSQYQQSTEMYMFQFGEQPLSDRSAGGPVLHSLTIPPDSTGMQSKLMSPADSIASNLISPADSFSSSFTPSTPCNPFAPTENLSMHSLNINAQHCADHVEGVPENVDSEAFPHDMTYATYSSWSAESLWQQDNGALLAEDFNLDAIPSIELGFSKFDQEMQLASSTSEAAQDGCEFDHPIDFSFPSDEQDFDDATPGPSSDHDRIPGLFDYENMNW